MIPNCTAARFSAPEIPPFTDSMSVAWLTWFLTSTLQGRRIEKQRAEMEAVRQQVRMGNETIFSIANAVEARDKSTGRHSFRVSEYAVLIARELGFSEEEQTQIRRTGLLHDIGKIGVPDSVLNKPARLTDEEYEIMKTHTLIGGEILKDFTLIPHVDEGAKFHHERYDGTGYPSGLKGEEIPLNARIIGIADAFDAMTANRVYRKALDMDYVIAELKRCSGTQFDPGLVEIMLELIASGKIKRSQAKVGYVGAFSYAEVISGYTAFFLGVRSIVPEAEMIVRYTNTWSNHVIEKKTAEKLIDEGCVIISQHSDTEGPAIACEEASVKRGKVVFSVGYNQSMTDVAPTTSLVSSRINWSPYILGATEAVLKGKKIESVVKSPYKTTDSAAGFDRGWIEIVGLNTHILADGTTTEMEKTIKQFKNGSLTVFKGNFVGVNPFDESDVWDLRTPFIECEKRSAPSFCYVLGDVIEVRN